MLYLSEKGTRGDINEDIISTQPNLILILFFNNGICSELLCRNDQSITLPTTNSIRNSYWKLFFFQIPININSNDVWMNRVFGVGCVSIWYWWTQCSLSYICIVRIRIVRYVNAKHSSIQNISYFRIRNKWDVCSSVQWACAIQ